MKGLKFALLLQNLIAIVIAQDCTFLRGGARFKQPTPLKSTHTKWKVNLLAEKGYLKVDWFSIQRRTYNQKIPGPTIMVKQGDHLEISLENHLDTADKGGKLNENRFPDSTNLHLHGLHIDSKVPGDNVLIRIKPGQSYLYSYKIEDDQPAGTYWYHPHLHGSTILQVNSGMAGMLIVQDDEQKISDELKAVTCPFNCAHDVQLIFQSTLLYANNSTDPYVGIQNDYGDTVRSIVSRKAGCPPKTENFEDWLTYTSGLDSFTTNGQLNPVLSMPTGQMKRFRMVNAGGSPILELELVNIHAEQRDCEYLEIALDGVYLDRPRVPRQMKTLIVPGGRADWLVRCNAPGIYVVRSTPLEVDSNSTGTATRRFNGTLLTLKVTGPVQPFSIGNVPLPTRPEYVNFATKTDLATTFSIEIGPQLTLNRERFAGEHYFRHLVNVNETVQWNFLNTVPKEGHPIHIHVNHFKIVGYEPYTGPVGQTIQSNKTFPKQPWILFSQDTSSDDRVCYYQHEFYDEKYKEEVPGNDTLLSYPHHEIWNKDVPGTVGYSLRGDYRDTLMVPPLSNITIQFMVHKFTDIVVIHCHFLRHEDFGMMLLVDIIDPEEGDKTNVNPKSGNALPGQCSSSSKPLNSEQWHIFEAGATVWIVATVLLSVAVIVFTIVCCVRKNRSNPGQPLLSEATSLQSEQV